MFEMEKDIPLNPPLTPDQEAMADFLIDVCGLEGVAGVAIEMMGAVGTVRYGLGRCAVHIGNMEPADIQQMVLAKLTHQETPTGQASFTPILSFE